MIDRLRQLTTTIGIARQRAREGHLPVSRQMGEMVALWLLRGIGPNYYQAGALWRRELPWAHKLRYLSPKNLGARVEALNPRHYRKISQNKITEKAILNQFGIPTPEFLGVVSPGSGCDHGGIVIHTLKQLEDFLASHLGETLCFKIVEGWGGHRFRVAEILDGPEGILLKRKFTEETATVANFFAADFESCSTGPLIIERYFCQHPWYAAFHERSVNTFRLYALKPSGGYPELIGGYLRLGRGGALTDNEATGGISATVDLSTGRLIACTNMKPAYLSFTKHPESKVPIIGAEAPFWEESKALACRALDVFPKLRFAGVDVAVGPEGPTIIELNVIPNFTGMTLLPRPPDDNSLT